MVEASVVGVKAVNLHWQIPILTLAVVRTLGIYYPFIAWCTDVHLSGCRYEVGRDRAVEYTVSIFGVVQAEYQVFVVEILTWIELQLLGEYRYLIIIVTTWSVTCPCGICPCGI